MGARADAQYLQWEGRWNLRCLHGTFRIPPTPGDSLDDMPDIRDGLTRLQRVILLELRKAQEQEGGAISTALLYGRVVEHLDVSKQQFLRALTTLGAGR